MFRQAKEREMHRNISKDFSLNEKDLLVKESIF